MAPLAPASAGTIASSSMDFRLDNWGELRLDEVAATVRISIPPSSSSLSSKSQLNEDRLSLGDPLLAVCRIWAELSITGCWNSTTWGDKINNSSYWVSKSATSSKIVTLYLILLRYLDLGSTAGDFGPFLDPLYVLELGRQRPVSGRQKWRIIWKIGGAGALTVFWSGHQTRSVLQEILIEWILVSESWITRGVLPGNSPSVQSLPFEKNRRLKAIIIFFFKYLVVLVLVVVWVNVALNAKLVHFLNKLFFPPIGNTTPA